MPDAVAGVVGATTPPATSTVTRTDQMGKDVFLQLLVAQMRYQDPNSPTSTTEFMSQTATFTQVEKLEQIAAQNSAMATLQRSLGAGALVGQTVSYTDESGGTVTGTVGSVKISGDEPSAVVGGVDVPLGRLTEISVPGTS
ncbi:flagellar hook capping FlgD N-terminal domain-containing protein [Geodermatophilus sp. DSM 44513]|uniref:flagellar hook capping FlgD N-terminal domain-containing protein n=1 Tax=Geodermatophilus sp. DSM 44513 TaxID=1528104 RepID=UPI001271BB96|nr:flagellar hook capping FlgD N-terminal domain-containing protein [Geodermatophilus sp. DSM 44513]WNV76460.1 flagellar hook capping FlgD N-terminal domain-containing protein [Geodermatophilus sp. DSM 44513]